MCLYVLVIFILSVLFSLYTLTKSNNKIGKGDKAHKKLLNVEYKKLEPPSPNMNIDKTGYKENINSPKNICTMIMIVKRVQIIFLNMIDELLPNACIYVIRCNIKL